MAAGWSRLLRLGITAGFLLLLPACLLAALGVFGKLSTDLLELVPQSAATPGLEHSLDAVQAHFSHTLLASVAATDESDLDRSRARKWLRSLQKDERILDFWIHGDPIFPENLFQDPGPQVWTLLFPRWVAQRLSELDGSDENDLPKVLADLAAERLDAFLDEPEAAMAAAWIPHDPLLLVPETIARMGGERPASTQPTSTTLLLWVRAAHSPFEAEGQRALTSLSQELYEGLLSIFPDTTVSVKGVHQIAMEEEAGIRREVTRLNIISVLLIFGFLFSFFRSIRLTTLLLVPIASGVLWGMLATFLIFEHIHVLALGIGSVLFGVGIDYGLHLFTAAFESREKTLPAAFRSIRQPLLIAAGTSMLGFASLLLAPMPAVRQVGVLVPVGIAFALLTCRFLLPLLAPRIGELPSALQRFAKWGLPAALMRPVRVSLLALAAAGIAILWYPKFNDDIGAYQRPPTDTAAAYNALRHAFTGENPNGTIWLTHAPTAEELLARLADAKAVGGDTFLLDLVRSPDQVEGLESLLGEHTRFIKALQLALDERGYEVAAFEPAWQLMEQLRELLEPSAFEAAMAATSNQLEGPAGALLLQQDGHYLSVYPGSSTADTLPPETVLLDQRDRVNHALESARAALLKWLLVGVSLLAVCLMGLLGKHRGAYLCLLPTGSVIIPVAFLSLTQGLTLLGVLGAILGFCLALDYAAFSSENARGPVLSVRLSAITTATAFSVLILSSIPALAQLGLVVSVATLLAMLGAETQFLSIRFKP